MAAKKDKKARRFARKRKAQRSTQPSGQQILLKRARTSEHVKDAKVLVSPAGIVFHLNNCIDFTPNSGNLLVEGNVAFAI